MYLNSVVAQTPHVPEIQNDSTAKKRRAVCGYWNHILAIIQKTSLFSSIKQFRRLGKFELKQNWSVVVELTTSLARDSVLNRSRLLATLTLCNICLVPEVKNLPKYYLEPPKVPLCGTCRIDVSPLAPAPISPTTEASHKPVKSFDCLPSMSQVLIPQQKPAN